MTILISGGKAACEGQIKTLGFLWAQQQESSSVLSEDTCQARNRSQISGLPVWAALI